MKKLLFLGVLSASLSANAQILGEKVENAPGWCEALPGMFTTDNKACLVVDETSYPEYDDVPENFSPSMKVYDDELKLIKSIDIPSRNIKRGSESKVAVIDTIPGLKYEDKQAREIFEDSDITDYDMKDFLANAYGFRVDEIIVKDGIKYFYSKSRCYNYDKYGYEYARRYYTLEGRTLYIHEVTFDVEITPTGRWETVEDRTYYDKRGNIEQSAWYDFNGKSLYDYGGLTITQTLFNSDDKYEYIRTIFQQTSSTEEYDRNYDGEVDWITTYYEDETAGFEIVNEDGDVLQSIRYESLPYHHRFYLITINDKCYLAVEMENEDYSYTYEWYALTPGSSTGLKKVQAPVSVTARPAMAKRHESITIETTGDDKNREVNIVDASGKSVWKQTIPAGQKSIRVNAAKLSKGLNVVNVDGKKEQSVKVIVN